MRASMFQMMELVVRFLESRVVGESLRARGYMGWRIAKRAGCIMAAGKAWWSTTTDGEAIKVDDLGGDDAGVNLWHFTMMMGNKLWVCVVGWVVDIWTPGFPGQSFLRLRVLVVAGAERHV